ncbi:hypothetical protein D3C83_271310 [compost metagenome]
MWDLRTNAPAVRVGGRGPVGEEPGEGVELGPETAPGTYQVTVRVDGQESTAPVEVLADPRTVGVDFFGR